MTANSPEKIKTKGKPLENIFFFLLYGSSLLNLLFNFLGLPAVKYIYLAQLVFVFLSVFVGKKENHLWVYILLSLFEGQGRVLWGYGVFFRLIFDMMLGLMVLKDLARTKRVFDKEIIPKYLIIGIALHLFWWVLELFNPSGPDLFGAFATSKYYVFPFFLFFVLKSMRFDFSKSEVQKKLQDCLIIVLLSGILVIVQGFNGGELIASVSDNYVNLFPKYANFTEENYRPWGTSFLPGGMSAYFYCFIGLWLLYTPRVLFQGNLKKMALMSLIKWGGLGVLFYAAFLSQVRSSLLKLALIIFLFGLFKFLGSQLKAKRAMVAIFSLSLLLLASPFYSGSTLFETRSYEEGEADTVSRSLERWEGVFDSGITKHRAGIDLFLYAFDNSVPLPLGHGLGMTQSFLPQFEERRREHIEIPMAQFWHLDNLFMFLLLELGIGAIFYLFILVAVVISLFSRMFTLLRWRAMTSFTVVAAASSSVFVFIISNWGGVLLPYNPDSFYFWIFVALGFSTFYHEKKNRRQS